MSDSVITVENLSKSYLIGHEGPREQYQSLRETLVRNAKQFARKTLDTFKGKQMLQGDSIEEFWALKDVSFQVKQGEVLGIIGRNGAGKSTLLKVLSRITEPSSGRVKLRGRVASLLEVGTGFHPELTGRENIFLNGAILGMGRIEIKRKFDEIVDFAGVEKFLDTPVKRYSSGMYVRLAFAVAAHLEPEILVVDEVLAVGDGDFQKKCLGKMQSVAKGGRTVLFVSHDLHAVRKLCNRGIFLTQGTVTCDGPTDDVIASYLRSGKPDLDYSQRQGTGGVKVLSVAILNKNGEPADHINSEKEIMIRFDCISDGSYDSVMFAACFNTLENVRAVSLFSSYKGQAFKVKPGKFSATCKVPSLTLMPGDYNLITHIEAAGSSLDTIFDIRSIRIDLPKSSNFITSPDIRQGFFIEDFEWTIL